VPECTPEGQYVSLQCMPNVNECFCVDKNGVELKHSRSKDRKPDCESEGIFVEIFCYFFSKKFFSILDLKFGLTTRINLKWILNIKKKRRRWGFVFTFFLKLIIGIFKKP